MTDDGLTITLTRTSGNGFEVANVGTGAAGWGANQMHNFNFGHPAGDEYNANFSAGIYAFAVDFGDFNQDSDTPVTLEAFSGLNGTGALLATASTTWLGSDSFPNFKSLLVFSGAPILSVRFTGGGPFPNSLFWDNLRTDQNAVPEPMTLSLLGAGLLGLAARRRRKA